MNRRGRLGEECAAAWLAERGWTILNRNWTVGGGELDIVARRGGILAFIEVKARAGNAWAPPAAWVDRQKRARVAQCAEQYLLDHPREACLQPRFDVAEVLLSRESGEALGVRYLPDAFTLDDI